MDSFQSLAGHMGIDLSGRDIRVAEQKLNGPEVSTAFKKMAGEGVAQTVRCNLLWNPCLYTVFFDNFPESLP